MQTTLTTLLFALCASFLEPVAPLEATGHPPRGQLGGSLSLVFDCNKNGIQDAVDIALGSSADANNNGIPDECEAQ
ncbi:MAG: hypothetical protein ABGY71_04125 [bacterium]|nr:hypothetical protein [Planctomycetota bacterium]HIL52889.1 hypothetical protein [Planctomycetota bacterium]